jgi:hypothetical protein
MKILIQNFDAWPAVAEPAVWRELLDCSHLTMQRAERSGALVRFLMQHLTTATNDPLPLFFRIADADPHLRRYLFGRQRPGTRMEAMSWYWRFLLMIILVRQLNSRESGLSTI